MTPTATSPVLSLQSKRALAQLFEELDAVADALAGACRKKNWAEVDELVPKVKAYVRAIKDEIPTGLASKQVSELDRHTVFVERFAPKRDRDYVLSNAYPIRPDIQRLASALGIGGMVELRAAIEVLPAGIEREMLDEAVRCLEVESPRAAVVMAVGALENLLRSFYGSKTGKDSKMDFWKVIDEVAKMQGLSDPERLLLDQCRVFRNFAAHPSEYNYTKGDAQGIIHLAAEQVRKWNKPVA